MWLGLALSLQKFGVLGPVQEGRNFMVCYFGRQILYAGQKSAQTTSRSNLSCVPLGAYDGIVPLMICHSRLFVGRINIPMV